SRARPASPTTRMWVSSMPSAGNSPVAIGPSAPFVLCPSRSATHTGPGPSPRPPASSTRPRVSPTRSGVGSPDGERSRYGGGGPGLVHRGSEADRTAQSTWLPVDRPGAAGRQRGLPTIGAVGVGGDPLLGLVHRP